MEIPRARATPMGPQADGGDALHLVPPETGVGDYERCVVLYNALYNGGAECYTTAHENDGLPVL